MRWLLPQVRLKPDTTYPTDRTLRQKRNSITRSPVDLALALFRTSCWWMIHAAFGGSKEPPLHTQPSADTRRASNSPILEPFSAIARLSALGRSVRLLSLCLHALSSFQRTGLLGPAPTGTAQRCSSGSSGTAQRCSCGRGPHRSAFPSVLGEPSEVTIQNLLCQARA
jgi:hypothetical protein